MDLITKEIELEMKSYSDNWDIASKHNEREGYYDWMLNQLTPHSSVLEIGCGAGISTFKLFNNSKLIVSIDENPFCVDKAFAYFSDNNIDISLEKRIGDIVICNGKNKKGTKWVYKRRLKKISDKSRSNILIEGDILNDKELTLWLVENYKFDYIVCWLMGTYDYKTLDDNYDGVFLSSTKDEYRWKVLNKLIELQQWFSPTKPVIHVVDRIELPKNENEERYIVEDYSQKLKISMAKMEVTFKKYKVGRGVELISIDDKGKNNSINNIDIGLISVLIRP